MHSRLPALACLLLLLGISCRSSPPTRAPAQEPASPRSPHSHPQERDDAGPGSPSRRYGAIFYGSATSTSPNRIILEGNNAAILEACVGGKSVQQLAKQGIRVTERQLERLRRYRLLERRGERLVTAFPALDVDATSALRRQMKQLATAALPQLRGGVEALKAALAPSAKGMDNTYTILFAYVIDGLVWDEFAALGHPTTGGQPDNKLWSGVVWMLSPPRGFRSGTNSITDGDTTFKLHWSDAARAQLRPFLGSWGTTRQLALELLRKGRVDSADLLKRYRPYGIFDAAGRSLLPVIEERPGDAAYDASKALATRTAQAFLRGVDLARLGRQLGVAGTREALVIAYHEWMWELVDLLEREQIVSRPRAFSAPEQASPAQLGALIFLVKKPPRSSPER